MRLRAMHLLLKMFLVGCVALLSGAPLAFGDQMPSNKLASTSQANTNQIETFTQPKTLDELLALSPEQLDKVDVALMNLLCAEGLRGSENLDVQSCLDTLDAWARHVRRETDRNFHRFAEHPEQFDKSLVYYRMGMLGTVLAQDLEINTIRNASNNYFMARLNLIR